MSIPLIISAVWATGLLGLYLWLARRPFGSEVSAPRAVAIICAVALLARLVPNLLLSNGAGYDISSYRVVGDLVRAGRDVYADPAATRRYPYLPLQMYWMAFAGWLSDGANLPFGAIVRLAPIAADTAIALVLWLSLRRSQAAASAFQGGLLYAVNPLPVFVAAYHGQFDAIPALCILIALLSLERRSPIDPRSHAKLRQGMDLNPSRAFARLRGSGFLTGPLVAGVWLGLGVLDKSWPVLGLPTFLLAARPWRARARLLGAAVLVPLFALALYVFVFDATLWAVLERALSYNSGVGVWGYTYFFNLIGNLEPEQRAAILWLGRFGRFLTLAGLGLVWLLRARRETPAAALLTILVAFLALTHAFAIQYLMWLVPFALLGREIRWLTLYTVCAFAYMLLVYTTLILELHITDLLPMPQADWFIIMPAGLPAWLVTIAWLRSRLRGRLDDRGNKSFVYGAALPNRQS